MAHSGSYLNIANPIIIISQQYSGRTVCNGSEQCIYFILVFICFSMIIIGCNLAVFTNRQGMTSFVIGQGLTYDCISFTICLMCSRGQHKITKSCFD